MVVSADMGAPALDDIRRTLPGQFVNVGIAEQNAATVRRLGLPMEAGYCYRYGGREVILRHYGLGEKQIRKQIVDFCARRAGK